MGDIVGSAQSRSIPIQLRHLLEAADAPAHEQAWTEFLESYSRLILYVARQKPRDDDGVMDRYAFVVEKLCEHDCRRLRTFAADGRGKFTTWLIVVVRRLCLDHDRHKYGRAPHASGNTVVERATELVVDSAMMDCVADDAPLADEKLEKKQMLERLETATARLDARDRLLLALRYDDNRSAREIASIMSLPTPFHVYRRLTRIHDALREALAGFSDEEIEPTRAAPHSAAVQYSWRRGQRFEPTR
jgi:RNA polymerase sigma factor (sigma-70 family)